MKMVILGSTGLAGQAFKNAASARKIDLQTVARSGANISCDVSQKDELIDVLTSEDPDVLINCVGLVNLAVCESDPGLSWRVNARPASIIAEWSKKTGRPFIHISTDHFFGEGGHAPHSEEAPVVLLNEYARTKFVSEALALTAPQALVLRTSIVGIRSWKEPSFAEWAISAVAENRKMTLFRDAWTSSIDTPTFADAALKLLIDRSIRGLLNLAAGEVYTKEAFVRELARQMDIRLTNATSGTVHDLLPRRATSLGLDVSRAELLLDEKLPKLQQVVANILAEYTRSRQQ